MEEVIFYYNIVMIRTDKSLQKTICMK